MRYQGEVQGATPREAGGGERGKRHFAAGDSGAMAHRVEQHNSTCTVQCSTAVRIVNVQHLHKSTEVIVSSEASVTVAAVVCAQRAVTHAHAAFCFLTMACLTPSFGWSPFSEKHSKNLAAGAWHFSCTRGKWSARRSSADWEEAMFSRVLLTRAIYCGG